MATSVPVSKEQKNVHSRFTLRKWSRAEFPRWSQLSWPGAIEMSESEIYPALEQLQPLDSSSTGIKRIRPAGLVDNAQCLTARQHEIMNLVVAGHPSKTIASDLGISRRTVENHRASIMKKTGSKSIPALVRMSITAGFSKLVEPISQ